MMKAIFKGYGEPTDKLKVNTQASTVLLKSTVDDIKVGIVLAWCKD